MSLEESALRILICARPGIGEEGAYETLAVTEHWGHMYADASFLVLTDVSKFNRLELPPHLDYIHIPTISSGAMQLALRQQIVATTVAHFAPHVVVVQCGLTAVAETEVTDIAHYIHRNHSETRLILGLWTENQGNTALTSRTVSLDTYQKLGTLYEQIWLYTPFPVLAHQLHSNSSSYQPLTGHDERPTNGRYHP